MSKTGKKYSQGCPFEKSNRKNDQGEMTEKKGEMGEAQTPKYPQCCFQKKTTKMT